MIFDTFEDMIFEGSELGHNILGTKAALARHGTDSIRRFTGRTYTTDKMVFSSIGNFSITTARDTAARYLAERHTPTRSFERAVPAVTPAFEKVLNKHTHQVHCIVGARAYDINDERRVPLSLLVNILGGPSANSLLNVLLREKNGLSYNIEASYSPYNDCGFVAIYFSSEHDNADQCRELIARQIDLMRRETLSARRLSMAKSSSSHRWPSRWRTTRAICSERERACSCMTISTRSRRSTARLRPSRPNRLRM